MGCWESLGRRLSSWREWQRFDNVEIYKSHRKIKVTTNSLCAGAWVHTVCMLSSALTRLCAACICIWACSIQHSWLPVFLFMNKKISPKVYPTSKLSVSRLWSQEINALAACDSVTVHLKNMKENDQNDQKKKMPEKTDKKLCLKKVLTALKKGEEWAVCPQKADLWRSLLCSFTFIIRIAQSWSACIWYDTALLPYCSRDLGLRDVLPKGFHSHYINVSWHLP